MDHPMVQQQLAPYAESYAPAEPEFQFTPTQREKDFALLVASGAAPTEALSACGIVSEADTLNLPRAQLYRMATRLLSSEAVQERIDYYRILHNHNLSVTADRLRQELAAISFADIAEAFDPGTGQPHTNPHDIPRHLRAAIKEFYIDKDGVTRFKLHDKLKAAQMVGDLEGHFDEANKAKAPQVTINLAQQTNITTASEDDSRPVLALTSKSLSSDGNGNSFPSPEESWGSSSEAVDIYHNDNNNDNTQPQDLPECLL
jgi:hypothetical protein